MNVRKLGASAGVAGAIGLLLITGSPALLGDKASIKQAAISAIMSRDETQKCMADPRGYENCWTDYLAHPLDNWPTEAEDIEAFFATGFEIFVPILRDLLAGFLVPYAVVLYGPRVFRRWSTWVRT